MSPSISGVTPTPLPPVPGSQASATHNSVTTAAAQLLGMPVPDLRNALQSGASLAGLAEQNGVSRDDLVNTVTQAVQSSPTGQPAPVDSDVPTQAQQLVDQPNLGRPTHAHRHHHHHGPGPLPPVQNGAAGANGTVDTVA